MNEAEQMSKIANIKALALDCDGILSDAQIYYIGNGKWGRSYSIRDGWGIKKLQKAGIIVTVITTSDTEDIHERMKTLGIDLWYPGSKNKIEAWQDFLSKNSLTDAEVAYMGDDEPDLPLIEKAGFSATVAEAMPIVKEKVNYICNSMGGRGAVREVCEMILAAKA